MRSLARVESVEEHYAGTELTSQSTAGATTHFVEDTTWCQDGGGPVVIGTEGLTYDDFDEDLDTIHTTTGVVSTWPAETEVRPPDGDRAVNRYASLFIQGQEDEDGAEPATARVQAWMFDRLDIGERQALQGEWVVVEEIGDELWVVDFPGEELTANVGDYGENIPTNPTDGSPPVTSPPPTVIPGIGSLFVTWGAIANADPVTYEVHISTSSGFTPSAGTKLLETPGTMTNIRTTPDTLPLLYETTYYIKIVAIDDDGAASASTEASGSPVQATIADLAVGYLQAGGISVSDLLAGTLNAEVLIAALMRTAADGRRVEIDSNGIRLYDQNNNPVIIAPTDTDDPATFNGDLVANTLTALGAVELRSALNVLAKESVTTLLAGQSAPVAVPSMSQNIGSYAMDSVGGDLGDLVGIWHDGTNTWFFYHDVTAGSDFNSVEKRDASGSTILATKAPFTIANTTDRIVGNMVKIGTTWFALIWRQSNGTMRWNTYDSDVDGLPNTIQNSGTMGQSQRVGDLVAMDIDGTNIKMVQARTNNTAWLGTYTTSGTAIPTFSTSVNTTETWNWGGPGAGCKSAMYETADFGAARWVFKTYLGAIGVYNTTPTRQTSQEWPTQNALGFLWYDSVSSRFKEDNYSSELVYIFENVFWGTTKYWAAFTWYDSDASGGTHETALSPRGSITMLNRRGMFVTWPMIPDAGGVDDPNSVRIYLKQNASDPGASFASYFRQGTTHVGLTAQFTSYSTATAGSQDTAFVGGTGATIKSAVDDATHDPFELRGDGTFLHSAMATSARPQTPPQRQVLFDIDVSALLIKSNAHDSRIWTPAQRLLMPGRFATWESDLLGPGDEISTFGGGSTIIQFPTATANHPGVVELHSVAVGDNARWAMGANHLRTGDGLIYHSMLIRSASNLSTSTQRYRYVMGLYDNQLEANIVNGIYFLYQDNIGNSPGNWNARLRAGGTLTADAGTDDNGGAVVVAGDTWYFLEIVVSADGTTADFYINGVKKSTMTTGMPSVGSTFEMRGGIEKVVGGTGRSLFLDYVGCAKEVSGARF